MGSTRAAVDVLIADFPSPALEETGRCLNGNHAVSPYVLLNSSLDRRQMLLVEAIDIGHRPEECLERLGFRDAKTGEERNHHNVVEGEPKLLGTVVQTKACAPAGERHIRAGVLHSLTYLEK